MCDALLQMLRPGLEFAIREVHVVVVDRIELAAVDGHDRLGEQSQASAQDHKSDRFSASTYRFSLHEPPATKFRTPLVERGITETLHST